LARRAQWVDRRNVCVSLRLAAGARIVTCAVSRRCTNGAVGTITTTALSRGGVRKCRGIRLS
jgi:hypothetical protein